MSQSLNELAQEWLEHYQKFADTVGKTNLLDPKLVVLIRLIIDVTATHLYAPGVQQHLQEALKLGLSRAEIMEVFKLASVVGIHSCALGVPLLEAELRQLNRADQENDPAQAVETPICNELRAQGNFNPLWDTLYRWDPAYLEDFLKMAMHSWRNKILPPLWVELLCIAGDATITHIWSPGMQRHMRAALALGASQEQIMEVLKILSLQGMEAFETGFPILAQVLETSVNHP
ncbi:carboxymuconolactone decarboxylase family protein [Acinetobacter sp.]|jgi:alkylhydroperoxidase/carboxymuconolactone decarboxylase family protein YurZ|uniref:carboxymuconolactone decarboxylase family protein n=1 Tax=Acinetobacter sp. TaxID=472 RepID=UPI0035B04E7D